jgi:hypothetical protein
MSISYTITRSYKRNGEEYSFNDIVEGSGEANIDETVPEDAATDFPIAIDVSALQALYIVATRDMTLDTNAGDADDSFELKANVPLEWSINCGLPNPFVSETDVESIRATLAAGANANLIVRALVDVTPD